jgi:hypothetical protein
MNYKKILLICVAASLLLAAVPAVAVASTSKRATSATASSRPPSGALDNDASITPEVARGLKVATEAKERAHGVAGAKRLGSTRDTGASDIGVQALNKYGYWARPVSLFMQETSYWCGPATVRQSLSYHKSASGSGVSLPSQSTLANEIGTTTSGSVTTAMVRTLNSYSGKFGSIYYVASDIEDTSNPYESFVNRIGTMLRSGSTAPIILVQTNYLERYKGHSTRHYITISGFDDRTSTITMRSVDPNRDLRFYGTRWEPVGTTTTAFGLCRATYQADIGKTNKVMAW